MRRLAWGLVWVSACGGSSDESEACDTDDPFDVYALYIDAACEWATRCPDWEMSVEECVEASSVGLFSVRNTCNALDCVTVLATDPCSYGRATWPPPVCYTWDDYTRYEPPSKAWLEGWSYEGW